MEATQIPSTRRHRALARRSKTSLADQLLNLLAGSADGVFAVDANQRIVFWSPAAQELLGRTSREALGKYCHEVISGSDYEGHPFCRRNCPVIRAVRRGHAVPNYDIACRRNGGEVWLNVSIVPVTGAKGDAKAIHMIRDVSQRRQSERLAQATVETVSQFMSKASGTDSESGPYPVPDPSLTSREIEVLRLLAEGLGTSAVARRLGLSSATVRNHIQRLLAKLGAHSRLEAVVYGARRLLI